MSIAIRERLEDEEGFTLIELLVVVIIIGILAAIAIPTFLNQRQNGYRAALTSDVRNAAIEVETSFTANQAYPTAAQYTALAIKKSTAATALAYVTGTGTGGATGFCITGTRPDLTVAPTSVVYDSTNGGLQGASGSCSIS